jgi:transposase InsO family protein
MVGPARKRTAVGHLQRELELSQRRACKVVGQPRATQRHTPPPDAEEDRLRARLNAFSRQRPRAGYRTACGQLRQEGLRVNPKRVHRLWREEGLKVPRQQCKKRRLGTSENGSQRRVATRPNEVWSYDFVSDQTTDGRRLKYLCVVDEFTRESLALAVRRSFRAKDVIVVLAGLVALRGAPGHLRSDNGPEFVALAVQAWLQAHAVGRCISRRGVRGRTRMWNRSTAGCGTSI